MGPDVENTKKPPTSLELDVKQTNQPIDENLNINETTVRSTTEDNHVLNDGLDVNIVDIPGEHEEDVNNDGSKLKNNKKAGEDIIETAKHESIETNETDNLIVDYNTHNKKQDTIKEMVREGEERREKEEVSETKQEVHESQPPRQFDSTLNTNTISATSIDNTNNATIQEKVQRESLKQNEDKNNILLKQHEQMAGKTKYEETERITTIRKDKDEDEWEDLSEETNEDKIILPKRTTNKNFITATYDNNNNTNISSSTTLTNENAGNESELSTTTIEIRKATNPFRVISVSSATSASSSRVSSVSNNNTSYSNGRKVSFQKDNNYNVNMDDNSSDHKTGEDIVNLQNRHEYLMNKCIKLEKEIKYLRQMENQSSLTLEDSKKLNRAIDKLQEYLDRKTKERYEIGVLLSKQLRRQINRGENGEFWIGRK